MVRGRGAREGQCVFFKIFMVLGLAFRSLIHSFSMVLGKGPCGYTVFPALFVEKTAFPTKWSWHSCQRLHQPSFLVYMSVFMLEPHCFDCCNFIDNF